MPKDRFIKTYIPRFDEALGGGIQRGKGLGIYGSLGIGKTILCMQIAYNNLSNGNKVCYLTDDESADDILYSMRSFGWDPEPFSESFFIEDRLTRLEMDASEQLDASMDESAQTGTGPSRMDMLKFLNSTLSNIREYFDGYPDVLVFDSATPWLLQIGGRTLYLVLQVAKRMLARSTASIVTVQSGVVDQSTMNSLFSLSDYLIQMERGVDGHSIRIEKSKTRVENPVLPYRISNEGISFVTREPEQVEPFLELTGGAFSSSLGIDQDNLRGRQILFELDPLTRYDRPIRDFCVESINQDQDVIIITRRSSPIYRILDGEDNVHFRTSTEGTLRTPIEQYTDRNVVMVIDGLTEKIILEGFETAFNYIKNAIELFSEMGVTSLFMINPKAHSPQHISTIRGLFSNHLAYDSKGLKKILLT